MGYIHGQDRHQRVLFPDSLDAYIDAANPVRFLNVFVDGLALKALGFTHATPNQTGRPSYHPKDMLKLYLYGYVNKMRSSRKLAHESQRTARWWREDVLGACPRVPTLPHLVSGACPSPRTFGPRCLQTPPRGDALALPLSFGSTHTWTGDFHPRA